MEYDFNHYSWYGNERVRVTLPDNWDIDVCAMKADECAALTKDQLKEKIDRPYGTKTIRELAEGKHEVVILFDDMSRGTPCKDIAEIILEELHEAGISREHIRFICALGSHGACTRIDFEKKLGADILKKYAVFNHSPFENVTYVGTTSGGVEIHINQEVMLCDLKIGIGSISPHPVNGYGGGGKIAMIGCAGIQTIDQLHEASAGCFRRKKLTPLSGAGNLEVDGMRKEIEEAVRMIGLDYKIDAILNTGCEIVDCVAGDPNEEYYVGAEISRKLNFADHTPQDMDVVIVNANVKANEAAIALSMAHFLLKEKGGSIVLIDHTLGGQVVHFYGGAFGYNIGGKSFPGIFNRCPKAKQVIYYTPYPDIASMIAFGDDKAITPAETWDEVMECLKEYGAGTKAALITDGTIIAFPLE